MNEQKYIPNPAYETADIEIEFFLHPDVFKPASQYIELSDGSTLRTVVEPRP